MNTSQSSFRSPFFTASALFPWRSTHWWLPICISNKSCKSPLTQTMHREIRIHHFSPWTTCCFRPPLVALTIFSVPRSWTLNIFYVFGNFCHTFNQLWNLSWDTLFFPFSSLAASLAPSRTYLDYRHRSTGAPAFGAVLLLPLLVHPAHCHCQSLKTLLFM